MRFYWPIAKVDAAERMVWGYASTEAEDDQGETVTRAALALALDDYMRFANIREMHQPSAVGVATGAEIDDKGLYLAAHIVDDEAWKKVAAGVYKGFSIGGRVIARAPADRRMITGLQLTEISLVDRPANPEAVFDCWKRAAADDAALVRPTVGRTQSAEPAADPHEAPDYADPGYRPDGRPRYPLDSARHIRAAWAYIHQARNAEPYTPAQLARIKARIVAAWEAQIDPAGPPAAAPERPPRPDVARKGASLADRLTAVIAALCDIADELAGDPPDDTETSFADLAAIPSVAALRKALAAPAADGLAKLADAILPRLDALHERVERIAQTPLPAQTAAHGFASLAKRDDGAGAAPESDIVAALARLSEEDRTLLLIKAAHATPIRR